MLPRSSRACKAPARNVHTTPRTSTTHVVETRSFQESVRRGHLGHMTHVVNPKRTGEVKRLVNSWTETGFKPIHVAVVWNEAESLRFLISHSARVNAKSDNGETPLWLAAQRGQLPLVKQDLFQLLATNDIDPNLASSASLTTPLHEAAANNRPEVVRALIESGAAPNQMAKSGWCALQYAADRGHHLCVIALLEGGAQPDFHLHTNSSPSPLFLASAKGHLNAMQALLCAGAQPNFWLPETRETPLIIAAKSGFAPAVKLLLERNADTRTADHQDLAALHYAARRGSADIVAMLLANGASLDVRSVDGSTPLHLAAGLGHKATCALLLSRNANTAIKTEEGDTALHLACKRNQSEVVSMLVEAKSPLSALNNAGYSALHIACQQGNMFTVKTLLEAGSSVSLRSPISGEEPAHCSAKAGTDKVSAILDLHQAKFNTRNAEGFTPLQLAAQHGFTEFVKWLLTKGSVNDLDAPHASPSALQLALLGKHESVARLLLVRGSNPNRSAESMSHPLFLALEMASLSLFAMMLSLGANVNVRNARGLTPLMIAAEAGKRDAIAALLKAGAKRNEQSPEGLTALQYALQASNEEVIAMLSSPPPARVAKRPEIDVDKILQNVLRRSPK